MVRGAEEATGEESKEVPRFPNEISDSDSQRIPVLDLQRHSEHSGAASSDAEDEDDDAAVILQELSSNFGLSARTPTPISGSAAIMSALSKAGRRSRNSSSPRSVLRDCITRTLMDVSRKTKVNQPQFKRLLSAKRNHINDLSNDISVLQDRVKEQNDENKVLTRISKRQESALKKFHDTESHLPRVLEMHRIEIRMLQEKLKKSLETNKKDAETMKKMDERLLKQSDELYRLRSLMTQKALPERDVLNKKLVAAEKNLTEKTQENSELSRRLQLLQKSVTQQVEAEVDRHKRTQKDFLKLKAEHEETLKKLQAVEKELGSLQHFRSRASRIFSSSFSSTTNISTITDGSSESTSGRLSRRSASRRLRNRSESLGKDRGKMAVTTKNTITTSLLDLSLEKPSWTPDRQINGISTDSTYKDDEFLPGKKSSASSGNLSSESSSGVQSKVEVVDDKDSRKTTIQSMWSDTTQEGNSGHSRSNSSSNPTPLTNDTKEEGSEDEFFSHRMTNSEGYFSLIENYPPKERRKFQHGVDPGNSSDTSSHGTNSPPRDTDVLPSSVPVEGPSHLSKLKGVDPLLSSRGSSAQRRRSLKQQSSLVNARGVSALSIEDRESSYTQTDPVESGDKV